MNHFELTGRSLAYVATIYSLGLVSWAIARRVLPAGTRVGLRLATVLVGQFVGCAVLVQSLGLLGQFRTGPYLAATLAAGAAITWKLRKRRPHLSLWRLTRDTLHLWLNKTPLGLGYASALGCIFLAYRHFAYVVGVDSLTIHGPLVARWVQTGRVGLATHWNYPQCWEYQYAPNFLLLRSDVLVIIPSLLQVAVLLLLVREVASRLRLPGKIAALVSLLSVSNPVVWGGTMKNDPAFAIGLLLSFLALERVARGRPGAIWLSQLGTFMILGTKASGFVYAGPLLGLFVTVWLIRRWRQPGSGWHLAGLLAGTLALQISAAAVQVHNLVRRGNPTYPIRFQVAGQVIFDGPGDLGGTSILEAGREIDSWLTLLRGSAFQLGLDFPFLSILLLMGTLHGAGLAIRELSRGRRPDRQTFTFSALAISTCLLWVLYAATPWTRGNQADPMGYLRHGSSLRYAIGPVCFSYVLAAAFLLRYLGRRRVFTLVSLGFPVLVFAKWSIRKVWNGPILVLFWKLFVLAAVLCGTGWAAAALWRRSSRLAAVPRSGVRAVVATGAATLLLILYAQQIEEGRSWKWQQPHRKLWQYVRHEVPSGVVIGSNSREPLWAYFLLGARLENEIRHLPLRRGRVEGMDDPGYYYLYVRGSETRRDRALAALKRRGWKPLRESGDKQGVLLQRPQMIRKPTSRP